MKYSLKYIELDADGKPVEFRALNLSFDKVVYTANLFALQSLKERKEIKHRDRRYLIVDENDQPIDALRQVPVEVIAAIPKKKKKKELTLEEVKRCLRRC